MNAQRLNDIYKNIHIAENSDIENIKQLTVDYPFYHLPYVVLAKYYYDTSHYKFEDMLKQAAMRVKDRKELYHYIHGYGETAAESNVDPDNFKYEDPANIVLPAETTAVEDSALVNEKEVEVAEAGVLDPTYASVDITEQPAIESMEPTKVGLHDFLDDYQNEEGLEEKAAGEATQEFVFEGRQNELSINEIEIDKDIIGEEIAAEFSFSHAFKIETPETRETEEPIEKHEDIKEVQPEQPDIPKTLNEHLRKNPVYNIETAVHVEGNDNEELSPEKDFFAWLQHPQYVQETPETGTGETPQENTEFHDKKMDLIEKFISINPQISRPKKEFFNPENMAKKSELLDLEYVTETLANIYLEQGNTDLAIKAYEKLSLQNPSKQAYFASLIEKIKKEK